MAPELQLSIDGGRWKPFKNIYLWHYNIEIIYCILSTVYVFLGEHIALVDFVKVLQKRGLLTNGEYAVVAVDDEIYDPSTAAITHAGKSLNM